MALVPGCRVLPDGTPSAMLTDRLAAALELHRRGLAERILVSGDARHPCGDEPETMQRWLLARDVPAGAVLLDSGSRRTRDTMHRARSVYGLDRVVVCTQRFHLPRSLYLARHAGLDALGLVADRRPYRSGWVDDLRELVAETAAVVETG
jgi:SanA protein